MGKKLYIAVVAAGGKGTRMGAAVPKQLMSVGGRSVLEMSAAAMAAVPEIVHVIIVMPSDADAEPYIKAAAVVESSFGKSASVALGGAERSDSVKAGLSEAANIASLKGVPESNTFVLIHDGARPFVMRDVIERNIKALDSCDAVCTAVGSVDSVRILKDGVLNSKHLYPIIDTVALDRNSVFSVQTPQSFRLSTIRKAYEAADAAGFVSTDDASVAEFAGIPVALVEGDPANRKITVKGDLKMSVRVGNGYDVHRLAEGYRLILCGIPVPFSKGLEGHSDADVAAHAIADALLGAAGQGDIGKHFPDDDYRYLGADSMELLAEAKKIAGDPAIVNIDLTIIAERPKLSPYIGDMKKNVAAVLGIPESAVNVKATTTEGLGFEGRGEGIAALASCVIEGGSE